MRVNIEYGLNLDSDSWVPGNYHKPIFTYLKKGHFTLASEAVLTNHLERLVTFNDSTILVLGISVGQ